jgi:hypothetical protein
MLKMVECSAYLIARTGNDVRYSYIPVSLVKANGSRARNSEVIHSGMSTSWK